MDKNKRFVIVFLGLVLVLMLPNVAFALDSSIGSGLCNIVNAMRGQVGRGIATLAVIFVGIGAFFGKTSWALAINVGAGIAAIFGSLAIVTGITGAATGC